MMLLGGCGSPPAPPPEAPLAPTAATSAPRPPEPPAPEGHARASSEGLVARVRATELARARDLLAQIVPPAAIDQAGVELGLDPGTLTTSGALEKLGVDGAGVVTLETFQLDDRAAALADKLGGVQPDRDDASFGARYVETYRAARTPGWFLSRVRVPTTNDVLGDRVESALTRRGGRRSVIADRDTAFTLGRSVWHVKSEPGALRVELAIGDRPTDGRDVRSALAALGWWSATAAPALASTETLSLRMRPSVVRESGSLLSSLQLGDDVASTADPDAAQLFFARVARESAALRGIDAPDGTPRYDSVVVTGTEKSYALTSTLSAGAEAFRPSDWSTQGADVAVDGATLTVAVNGPLLYGWKVIPTRAGVNPYYLRDINVEGGRAGFPTELLLAGDAPFLLLREAMEEAEALGQATLPWMRKWERLGAVLVTPAGGSADTLYFGLLPASTTEEAAACALSRQETRCAPAERLKPKVVTSREGFRVTRRKIDGRWVVLASRSEVILKTAVVHVKSGARPAYAASLDPAAFGRALGLGRPLVMPTLQGGARLAADGRSYTFEIGP